MTPTIEQRKAAALNDLHAIVNGTTDEKHDCHVYMKKHGDTVYQALQKSAQVDGLIKIVEAIRDTATGDSVTIAAIKDAAREALQQFSAKEILDD